MRKHGFSLISLGEFHLVNWPKLFLARTFSHVWHILDANGPKHGESRISARSSGISGIPGTWANVVLLCATSRRDAITHIPWWSTTWYCWALSTSPRNRSICRSSRIFVVGWSYIVMVKGLVSLLLILSLTKALLIIAREGDSGDSAVGGDGISTILASRYNLEWPYYQWMALKIPMRCCWSWRRRKKWRYIWNFSWQSLRPYTFTSPCNSTKSNDVQTFSSQSL